MSVTDVHADVVGRRNSPAETGHGFLECRILDKHGFARLSVASTTVNDPVAKIDSPDVRGLISFEFESQLASLRKVTV